MTSANEAARGSGYVVAILMLLLTAAPAATAQAPGSQYGFCQGIAGNPRVVGFTKVFVVAPAAASNALSGFLGYLHEKYGKWVTQEVGCRTFATAAEAQAAKQVELDAATPYPWPVVELDWTPAAGSAPAAAAPKPAPVAAPVKPVQATAAAAPVAAQPAAAPASKPGVYVICRSEWNTDLRRFYNPPVDGRGAGYPEWQASFGEYLVKQHGFKGGSNYSCGKYSTREAAQADYDAWVSAARASPTVNGRDSPIIITSWKY